MMQVATNPNMQVTHHYWWSILIRGIVAVIFGIATFIWPGLSLLLLVFFFGAYALVDGVVAVVVSIQERHTMQQWGLLLLEGIIGIVFGVLTFVWPAITALILLYIVAIWAIVTGLFEIAEAFSQRRSRRNEWTMVFAGIVSLVFGILLFIRPGAGLLSLIWLVAIYAVVFGVLLIVRAFQFKPSYKGRTVPENGLF
jgi:uncharacterized membrane protein HdeD (DUF308 family)